MYKTRIRTGEEHEELLRKVSRLDNKETVIIHFDDLSDVLYFSKHIHFDVVFQCNVKELHYDCIVSEVIDN